MFRARKKSILEQALCDAEINLEVDPGKGFFELLKEHQYDKYEDFSIEITKDQYREVEVWHNVISIMACEIKIIEKFNAFATINIRSWHQDTSLGSEKSYRLEDGFIEWEIAIVDLDSNMFHEYACYSNYDLDGRRISV